MLDKLRLAGPTDEYITTLAHATPGYVGADLASLTSAAGVIAVKRIFKGLLNGAFSANGDSSIEIVQDSVQPEGQTTENSGSPTGVQDIEMVTSDAQATEVESSTTAFTTLLRSTPLTPAQLSKLTIGLPDFLAALETTQPSATREGFTTRPDVSWSDIGALKEIREELEMAIVWPIRRYALNHLKHHRY